MLSDVTKLKFEGETACNDGKKIRFTRGNRILGLHMRMGETASQNCQVGFASLQMETFLPALHDSQTLKNKAQYCLLGT